MSSCKSCGQPHKAPNIIQKTINLSKAVVKHVIDGLGATPKDVQKARTYICRGCPFRDPFAKDLICTHEDCGCYIETKVTWASEECPIGLWDKYTDNKDLDKNNDEMHHNRKNGV